ncbi:hypothetical protein [Zooshikella ganghwensis]|uniref:hypothetical protein n=1 Tax=Zooshikella ganghwensis TaxID=202772 RepID=UPI0003F6C623|nr:hypothetical protein [Zooshikella ganghwensis]
MWFPVAFHDQNARRKGLREAFEAQLSQYKHYLLVEDGLTTENEIEMNQSVANEIATKLDSCSISYIGARHMLPVAPFTAFSSAPELGIARLEYLIDYGELPTKKGGKKWMTNALASILVVLFKENQNIRQVALPLELKEEDFGEFKIQRTNGVFHAVRT